MKKKIVTREEELQAELNAIKEKKFQERLDVEYPILNEKVSGKFFKLKTGEGSKKWYIYSKVGNLKREDMYFVRNNEATASLKGFTFQTNQFKEVIIRTDADLYSHYIGQPISEAEYNKAWNNMMAFINK